MTHSSKYLVATALFLAVTRCAWSAPALVDGSFESPVVPAGQVISSGGAGWTPSSSTVYIISNGTGFGNTQYGNQFLGLNPSQSDTQVVSGFQAGVTYSFGTYFADLLSGSAPTITVTLSGVVNLSQIFSTPIGGPYGANNIPFTNALVTFTPTTSGAETFTLLDNSPNGTLAVDNVTLVPEPSSLLIGMLGLGALFCGRRKLRFQRSKLAGA